MTASYFSMNGETDSRSIEPNTTVSALTSRYSRVNGRPCRKRQAASARMNSTEPAIAMRSPSVRSNDQNITSGPNSASPVRTRRG